jgi:hypothetical protein
MNALFDSAALAIVAYAHVDGNTGASTVTNSGVITSRNTTGQYIVALQTAMSQANCKDFVLVQPTAFTGPSDSGYVNPIASLVIDSQSTTKQINLGAGSTAVDCSFSIIILRTTIPTPMDQSGNQSGPS